jgi:DNA-binding transcriptional LysR family regulator
MPTEVALALQTYAEAMESTAASLERMASSRGEGVRGTVRVSASEVIGTEILPPIVTRLRERHPELKLELVLTNRVQDLLRREADIAVRMVRPQQDQLVARRVGLIEIGLHATRDYLAREGTPAEPSDLSGHSIIGYDQPSAFIRGAAKSFPGLSRDGFALSTDSDLAQLALIRCGAGIGICQVALARRDEALLRVLPMTHSLQLETWVTMHEDLRKSPRCRATFDALVEGLLDYIA